MPPTEHYQKETGAMITLYWGTDLKLQEITLKSKIILLIFITEQVSEAKLIRHTVKKMTINS